MLQVKNKMRAAFENIILLNIVTFILKFVKFVFVLMICWMQAAFFTEILNGGQVFIRVNIVELFLNNDFRIKMFQNLKKQIF